MTPEELDKATADEAWRLLEEGQDVAVIAARLAREQERKRAKVLVEPAAAIVNRAVKGTGANDVRWPHIVKAARRLEAGLNAYKRVTAVGPDGAVPPTDDASGVTFKIPPLKDSEPEGKEIDPRGTQMWFEQKLDDGRTARYRVTAFGPNGTVPATDDAPGVTFKSDLLKDPEPEMPKTAQEHAAAMFATATKPEPDLITLRLECLKLALQESSGTDYQRTADIFLHYVLTGSVDKA